MQFAKLAIYSRQFHYLQTKLTNCQSSVQAKEFRAALDLLCANLHARTRVYRRKNSCTSALRKLASTKWGNPKFADPVKIHVRAVYSTDYSISIRCSPP